MIYVECKPDFTLVKSITGIPKREIIHAGGKSEVCKRLEKNKNHKGVVDEDPWSVQPPYLKKLETKENLSDYELKLLDDNNDNRLIVLCPRLEDWILKTAKEADVDVRKYNLPEDPTKLHEVINNKIDKFDDLIENLKDHERLKILKNLLMRKK